MNKIDKINRKFQRNFLPGTIGLAPEDERDYYKRLQNQPIDFTNAVLICTERLDFENGITTYTWPSGRILIEASDGNTEYNPKTGTQKWTPSPYRRQPE